MKPKSQRQLQLGETIKRTMSDIFLREDILTLPGSYVTILEADVSPDAKNVKIYIDIFGNEEKHKEITEQLNLAAPALKTLMSQKMFSRNVPQIRFILDETAKNVEKIENLIKSESKNLKK